VTLIHRRDPARSMARLYALAVEADLLPGWSLLREWGLIGPPVACGLIRTPTWKSPRRPADSSRPASGERAMASAAAATMLVRRRFRGLRRVE
jgi:predicted DNA-binding WGR domain protein